MTWRRQGTYVAYPDGRAPEILGSSAHAGLGLDIAAWCESSRYALDGRLPLDRVRHIRGWTVERQRALVAAGFWRLTDGILELVDYLGYNASREKIVATQGRRAAVAKEAADARERDDRGQFAVDPDQQSAGADGIPDGDGQDGRRANDGQTTGKPSTIDDAPFAPIHAQRPSTLLGPSTSTSTSDVRGNSTGKSRSLEVVSKPHSKSRNVATAEAQPKPILDEMIGRVSIAAVASSFEEQMRAHGRGRRGPSR